MNCVPKLLPLWSDVTTQDLLRQKRKRCFGSYKFPDYGGFGVDIASRGDSYKCEVFKHTSNQVHFKANVCALPFLPPNKVEHFCGSSLETQKSKGNEYRTFCSKLQVMRRAVNTRGNERYKNEISACYKKVKRMINKSKYKEILVPEHIIELAEIYPEQDALFDANFSYVGNCLAASSMLNKHCLLYSGGSKLDKLCLTPLQESCDLDKHFSPVYSEQNIVDLEGGRVLEISSAVVGSCYIRKKDQLCFVNFEDPPDFKCEHRKEKGILNIAASPYNPAEVLSVYEKGRLKLKNMELRKTVWQTSDCHVRNSAWKCSHGSHPQSLLCLNKKKLNIYDLRQKEKLKTELFNTMYSSCYLGEELISLKRFERPFQYLLVSNQRLFICDERYPQTPVMVWSHMLKNSPLYCSTATYRSNENSSSTVVLLGTQEASEITAFFTECLQAQIHPISLSPQLFLSTSLDCIDSLKLHCLNIDESLVKRFASSLMGIYAVPHHQKTGFTAFHLTSYGDLFYQDFGKLLTDDKELSHQVDVGCILSPPSRILPHLKNWVNSIDIVIPEKTFSDKFLTQTNIDLSDILNLPEEISSTCVLCRNSDVYSKKKLVLSELCPTCGLSSLQSQELCKSFTNLSLQSGPLDDNSLLDYDENNLFQFHDTFSRKILEPWLKSSDLVININIEDEVPVCDFSSDLSNKSTLSMKMVASPAYLEKESRHLLTADNFSQMRNQNLSSFNFHAEDDIDEFVPPSQEFRQVIGETLRSVSKSRKYTSRAGF